MLSRIPLDNFTEFNFTMPGNKPGLEIVETQLSFTQLS